MSEIQSVGHFLRTSTGYRVTRIKRVMWLVDRIGEK